LALLFLKEGDSMSQNPLLRQTALDVSPEAEQVQRVELFSKNETSLLDLNRQKAIIESRRQELDVESKTKNLDIVERLNQNLAELVQLASDPNLARMVAGSIETGKDYNEFIKAIGALTAQRDNLLQKAFDISAQTGKRKRIEFAFAGQGVQMAVRVDTDGNE
jgi:hypothetical protein